MSNGEQSTSSRMAAAIHSICVGHTPAEALTALAIVIGAIEATASHPNLPALMGILTQIAEQTFEEMKGALDGNH